MDLHCSEARAAVISTNWGSLTGVLPRWAIDGAPVEQQIDDSSMHRR
jgi:hypothetical protein